MPLKYMYFLSMNRCEYILQKLSKLHSHQSVFREFEMNYYYANRIGILLLNNKKRSIEKLI